MRHDRVGLSVDTSCPIAGADLTADEFARVARVPRRTAQRWLAAWAQLGVEGVRRVPSKGRTGLAFRASPDLPERWARCELPAPQGVLREAA